MNIELTSGTYNLEERQGFVAVVLIFLSLFPPISNETQQPDLIRTRAVFHYLLYAFHAIFPTKHWVNCRVTLYPRNANKPNN